MVVAISNLLLLSWVLGAVLSVLGLLLGAFALHWTLERRTAEREWPRVDGEIVDWVLQATGDSEGYFAVYAYVAPDGQSRRGRPFAHKGHLEAGSLGPAPLLVDPTDHERFLVVGEDGNAFYRRLAFGLTTVGFIALTLAITGAD